MCYTNSRGRSRNCESAVVVVLLSLMDFKARRYREDTNQNRVKMNFKSRGYGEETSENRKTNFKSRGYGEERNENRKMNFKSRGYGEERDENRKTNLKSRGYGEERNENRKMNKSRGYGEERNGNRKVNFKSRGYGEERNENRKMNFKSRGSGEERDEKRMVSFPNLDRKRKRITAADQYMDGEVIHKEKGSFIKGGKKQMKGGSADGKLSGGPPRSIWVFSKRNDTTSQKNHPSIDIMSATEISKSKSKVKEASKLKKQSRSEADRNKQSLNGDTEMNDRPRKGKKIKLQRDPNDVSNKRLDDTIVSDTANTKERNKETEGEAEISKNAQFRAIQPSPSILSFVDDNLLGRRRLIDLKRAGYNIELSAPLDNIPLSTSSDRERIEENVFRNKLEFFAAAKVSTSFPAPDLPEIAFAGRSNVGKSSLLNALTRQWGVARTSDKPGLTQTINFFKLGPKLSLVDLPGYGFAYAKEEVKDAWEDLVKEYVSSRVGLKRVCLLIDTKWGMKPRDHELISLMERSQTKYQVILTKTDVVFPIDVARRAMQIEESLKANKSIVQPVMMVSSKSGAGIRSLRTVLSKIARFAKLSI
ncbi:P-loop containing nucleoside triphosphate hydrolases superfamily protein [Euphorbia peplus]|nr:P-loop containing nucleoside triphosphate hydrolases superfamily protein [Euphorbia peplus]